MRLEDIVYETPNGRAYVAMKRPGYYETYRNTVTGAVRLGTFHFSDRPDYALQRAKTHADGISHKGASL